MQLTSALCVYRKVTADNGGGGWLRPDFECLLRGGGCHFWDEDQKTFLSLVQFVEERFEQAAGQRKGAFLEGIRKSGQKVCVCPLCCSLCTHEGQWGLSDPPPYSSLQLLYSVNTHNTVCRAFML